MTRQITEAPYGPLTGKWITYWGTEPTWYGQDFLIIDQGKDNEKKIAFLADGKIQWRTIGASFSEPFDKTDNSSTQAVSNFLNPHEQSKSDIKAEITRLEEKLTELKTALKVLNSL